MGEPRKSRMISMRVTEEQFRYLDEMALRIRLATGFKITRASIILKLMEFGLPHMDREFSEDKYPSPLHHERLGKPRKKA